MLKIKYKGKSIIIPLKLAHFEYDDMNNKIKNTKAISKMIHSALQEYEIVPDESESNTIYQLVNVTSDGPYLHSKNDQGNPQITEDIKELIYTGPLFIGWIYDGAHELELVRKHLLSTNTDYSFDRINSSGLATLTRLKWTTTTINITTISITSTKISIIITNTFLGSFFLRIDKVR